MRKKTKEKEFSANQNISRKIERVSLYIAGVGLYRCDKEGTIFPGIVTEEEKTGGDDFPHFTQQFLSPLFLNKR